MAQDLSKNESDYKSHVIYVVPEEANSQKALKLLRRHRAVEEDVWVQDVRMLQAPLPAWLDGVPTIISRKEGTPHRGTACLKYLQQMQCATPEGMAALPAGMSGGFQDFGSGQPVSDFYEETDINYSENKWEGHDGKINDKLVDQYMAGREQQSSRFAQAPQAKELISTQS